MGFQTLENQSIEVDLLLQGNSTGWSVDNGIAIHEACNAGYIRLTGKETSAGETWSFTYRIDAISGSYVQAYLGDTAGVQRLAGGNYTETLVASGTSPVFKFYAPATTACRVAIFNIKKIDVNTQLRQENTTAFSEKTNKWNPHYTYNADCGFSLFTNLFLYKAGALWRSDISAEPRNNFFGQQYQSILQSVFNGAKGEPKTFQSISYEGNRLMVTSTDGIETSLGQISELSEADFLKDTLDDGVTVIAVYSEEGIYSAGLLRDKNVDLINGDVLKGTYLVVELQTVETGVLRLKNIRVHSEPSKIGAR